MVKCLSKLENLNLNPVSHIKQLGVVAHVCNSRPEEAETTRSVEHAGHLAYLINSEFQNLAKKTRWMATGNESRIDLWP